jgi:hypothetical protein
MPKELTQRVKKAGAPVKSISKRDLKGDKEV